MFQRLFSATGVVEEKKSKKKSDVEESEEEAPRNKEPELTGIKVLYATQTGTAKVLLPPKYLYFFTKITLKDPVMSSIKN